MAIRFTYSSTEYCQRTSDLPDHNAEYTICLWTRPDTFTQITHIVNLQETLGDWANQDDIYLDTDGVLWVEAFIDGVGTPVAGSTLSTGTWYHLALVRPSISELNLYLNGSFDDKNITNVSGRASAGSFAVGTFSSGSGNAYDGRVAAMKVWTRALSAAEIQTEMRSVKPVSPLSLYGYWPFAQGNDTMRPKDWSGKGRDWTEVNTPTSEESPPVAWGGRRAYAGRSSAAGVPRVMHHRKQQGIA